MSADHAFLSSSPAMPFYPDTALVGPLPPLAALPDDPFPDPSLPFDSLPSDYYCLDLSPPLSHADDSSSSRSSSGSSSSPLVAVSSPSASSTAASEAVEQSVAADEMRVRRKRSDRSNRERLMRKRRKQRECDVDRRYRENTALVQLQQFIREEEKTDDEPQLDSSDTSRLHKADILQQSVQLIEVLKRRVAELTDSHSPPAQPDSSLLTRVASSTIAAQLCHASLQSPMRDHSTVCLLLVHAPTNRIVDVTSRFLFCTGWQRPNIVGRRWPSLHTKRDTKQRAAGLRDNPVLVQGMGGLLVPSRQEPQYERSIRLRQQLYGGEVDTVEAVWRAQLADGKLYEFQATSWVSEWEEVEWGGGRGGSRRQPYQAMSVINSTKLVCVE